MNQMSNMQAFRKAWDSGFKQDESIRQFINKGSLGNINRDGDCTSDRAYSLTKNDHFFMMP